MNAWFRLLPLATFVTAASLTLAQTPDPAMVAKFKEEGLNHSQYMATLGYLSDVIGPRLTGSPALKRANEWTRDTMTRWGLSNAHLESWGPFGRGWELKQFSAQVTEPLDIPLIAFPKAWSPSLSRATTAEVVLIDATTEADLAKFKGQLKGKIVMNGGIKPIPARFTAQGTRYTDEQLAAMATGEPARPRNGNGAGGNGANRAGGAGAQGFRAQASLNALKYKMFLDEGVVAVLDESRGDDGTIFVQSATASNPIPAAPAAGASPVRPPSVWDASAPPTVPQVVVSAEQYNRMIRMLAAGVKIKMNVDLKAEFFKSDLNAYNTVAEIPGTDLKDQVVMVGGHMDSWHAGTGATDNGAGVAVAMEAARILLATGAKPRRTIRVALWSGEEEGLFGSRNYVAQHFGAITGQSPNSAFGGGGGAAATAPRTVDKKPEYDKISVYFNLDNGSGKIRGIYCQGNDKVAPIFKDWLTPFADMGASTVTLRNTGSTDHVSFDAIGIPGFQFIQDTIEYDTRTHHSNQDVFDRVQEDDMKQASVIMATFLYQAAMRDEMIPRKDVK